MPKIVRKIRTKAEKGRVSSSQFREFLQEKFSCNKFFGYRVRLNLIFVPKKGQGAGEITFYETSFRSKIPLLVLVKRISRLNFQRCLLTSPRLRSWANNLEKDQLLEMKTVLLKSLSQGNLSYTLAVDETLAEFRVQGKKYDSGSMILSFQLRR